MPTSWVWQPRFRWCGDETRHYLTDQAQRGLSFQWTATPKCHPIHPASCVQTERHGAPSRCQLRSGWPSCTSCGHTNLCRTAGCGLLSSRCLLHPGDTVGNSRSSICMCHYTHVLHTRSVWSPFAAPCELGPESVDHDELLSLLASFPALRGMKLVRSQGASIHPVHADCLDIFWTLHQEVLESHLTHQNALEDGSQYSWCEKMLQVPRSHKKKP